MTLDLNALGSKVQGFENFNLNNGSNTLKLTLSDVLGQKSGVAMQFSVLGGANDTVDLAIVGGSVVAGVHVGGSTWSIASTVTQNGHTFDVYHNASVATTNHNSDAYIEHGIHVAMV